MTYTSIYHPSFSRRDDSKVTSNLEPTLARLKRYARDPERVGECPPGLRAGYSLAQWATLAEDTRIEHIRSLVIREEVVRRLTEVATSRGEAPSESALKLVPELKTAQRATHSMSVAPTDVVPGTASAWISCAGGCGRLVAATTGRARVLFCSRHPAQRVRTKSRSGQSAGRKHKLRKHRRRAVCSGIGRAS